jgi:hypothetical protein
MIALDSNILARAIIQEAEPDDATQRQQAAAQALLTSGQALFLPITVGGCGVIFVLVSVDQTPTLSVLDGAEG